MSFNLTRHNNSNTFSVKTQKDSNKNFSNAFRLNTRAVAAETLFQILYKGRLSEDALNFGFEKVQRKDTRLLHAMCYGVLRWHGILQKQTIFLIGEQKSDLHPKVQLVIELGIWQIAEGYAEHAAIYECVAAVEQLGLERAKNFVNAILRKSQRSITDSGWSLHESTDLFPVWLEKLISAETFCQDEVLRLGIKTEEIVELTKENCNSLLKISKELHTIQPVISLRVQENRISLSNYIDQLKQLKIESEKGCFPNSLIIKQSISVEKLPGYAVGAFVVQDLAAQCAAHILNPKKGMKVLDACAAPGGKATHLQEIADNSLDLTALEFDSFRSRRLRENMGRCRTNGKVIVGSAFNPSEWWDGRAFQAILLDVPCSGTGVMRRNPDIPWVRKKEDVILQSSESLKMLQRLWSALDKGCNLLFVTCSTLPDENDFVIENFLRFQPNAQTIDFEVPLKSIKTIHGRQIIPSTVNDSLYYCLLQKS